MTFSLFACALHMPASGKARFLRFCIPFLLWAVSARAQDATPARDTLYWECDSTSREYRSRFDGLPRKGRTYDPALACGPYAVMERKGPEGMVERFQYCLQIGLKVKNGTFESRYASGRIKEIGIYAFDKKVGKWESWYPDGGMHTVQRYVDGKPQGISIEYWPNGKVKDEFKYQGGRIDCVDGYHRSYYEMGRLKVDFGVRDGRLVKYAFYDRQGKAMNLPVVLKD